MSSPNSNSQYKKYIEAFHLYYKQKNEYETKFKNKKNKIIRTNDTITNKKQLITLLKMKRKCINCKKKGGTLFTEEEGVLKAVCNADKKCKLNIEINKADNSYLPEYLEEQNSIINLIKKEITQYKLDLLFGLESEEIVTQEFKSLRANFKQTNKALNLIKDVYEQEVENMLVVKITNKEGKGLFIWKYTEDFDDSEKEIPLLDLDDLLDTNINDLIINPNANNLYISKKKYLDYLQLGFNKMISLYNEIIENYKKTNELSLIRDSLELYKTKIMPLLQFTRFIKYPVVFIDKQSNTSGFSKKLMPTFHFKPQKVNKQKELFPSKYNVISNKK